MNYITEILNNPIGIAATLVTVIFAAMEIQRIVLWIKGLLDGYHREQSQDEDFHSKVDRIATVTSEHTEALNGITATLLKINDRLDLMDRTTNERFDSFEAERKADVQATSRASLYQLYNEFADYETLTPSQYETFHDLAERYVQSGGNSAFKNYIIPLIEGKPVSDIIDKP